MLLIKRCCFGVPFLLCVYYFSLWLLLHVVERFNWSYIVKERSGGPYRGGGVNAWEKEPTSNPNWFSPTHETHQLVVTNLFVCSHWTSTISQRTMPTHSHFRNWTSTMTPSQTRLDLFPRAHYHKPLCTWRHRRIGLRRDPTPWWITRLLTTSRCCSLTWVSLRPLESPTSWSSCICKHAYICVLIYFLLSFFSFFQFGAFHQQIINNQRWTQTSWTQLPMTKKECKNIFH